MKLLLPQSVLRDPQLSVLVRELQSALERLEERLSRLPFDPRGRLTRDLDAGGRRIKNVGSPQSNDDALPLGNLEQELDRIETKALEATTSELDRYQGGRGSRRATTRLLRRIEELVETGLTDALPTAAPPAIADASAIGTTTDPPRFALQDHTHQTDVILTTKGDIIAHDGTSKVRVPVGPNGHVLTADSSMTAGVKWAPASGGAILTTKGDLLSHDGTAQGRLPVGTTGQVLRVNPSATFGIEWYTLPAGSGILTTKGDLLGHNGTVEQRLPVGTTGQVLRANSAATLGVEWYTLPPGSGILTTKGDLLGHTGTAEQRLPVGTTGQVLTVNPAATLGIEWATPSGGGGLTHPQVMARQVFAGPF